MSTTVGRNPFRRNGVAIIVNERVQNAVLGCNLKNDSMISVHFQSKLFNIMVIQVYALTSNAEEAEVEQFYEDLLELSSKKRCPFHCRGLEHKSRKSRNTWSNRQICPWSTEWSRSKANRVLPRECTDHSKHLLPTTQEKTLHMDISRWSTPKSDWLYSLQSKIREVLYSQQKQDQELTVAQIMNSLWPNSDWNWRKWGKPLDHSGMI